MTNNFVVRSNGYVLLLNRNDFSDNKTKKKMVKLTQRCHKLVMNTMAAAVLQHRAGQVIKLSNYPKYFRFEQFCRYEYDHVAKLL